MKCQSLFLKKNKKKYHQFVICLFSPESGIDIYCCLSPAGYGLNASLHFHMLTGFTALILNNFIWYTIPLDKRGYR